MRKDQIIISCKVSRPHDLIEIYRDLARKTDQPLHLGLTEAGMGAKGLVWSAASMGILLGEGIGDTVRVSLTPRPGGDRREEVYAACELLQSLGLRTFAPSVTACPGCGRTTSTTFQELAESIQGYIRDKMPEWKRHYEGVEELKLAVMGCIVNGPGESKASNIGISLPGTGEAPRCPVYIDGQNFTTLEGTYDELSAAFQTLRQRLHFDEISQARNAASSRCRNARRSREACSSSSARNPSKSRARSLHAANATRTANPAHKFFRIALDSPSARNFLKISRRTKQQWLASLAHHAMTETVANASPETAAPPDRFIAPAPPADWQRGFWSLIVTQFQTAFNDNALKFLVIYIIVAMNFPSSSATSWFSSSAHSSRFPSSSSRWPADTSPTATASAPSRSARSFLKSA